MEDGDILVFFQQLVPEKLQSTLHCPYCASESADLQLECYSASVTADDSTIVTAAIFRVV
jgi:hypothetical protein